MLPRNSLFAILPVLLMWSFLVNNTSAQEKISVKVGENCGNIANYLANEKYSQVLFSFAKIHGQSTVSFQVHEDFALCIHYDESTGKTKALQILECSTKSSGKMYQFGIPIDRFAITADSFIIEFPKKNEKQK